MNLFLIWIKFHFKVYCWFVCPGYLELIWDTQKTRLNSTQIQSTRLSLRLHFERPNIQVMIGENSMKVLLIQDVDNLGYAGDVKKVANGYGRNYLIPQKMAVLATSGALKQAETIRKAAEKRRAQQMEDAQAMANQLAGLKLVFERRAGETGKLYGSVTSGDIVEAIKAQTEIEVDKRKVALPEPIRSLGEQDVDIKLMIDVATTINVTVLPAGGVLEKERLEELEEESAEAPATETPAEGEVEAEAPTVREGETTSSAADEQAETGDTNEVEEPEETE
jgi:large subunit ribosomal protein L9